MSEYTIHVRGPLFDGRAVPVTRDMCAAIVDEVAAQAQADVMTNLNASIKHPTPYYETQVVTTHRGLLERSVNDHGVIYGPWLEGTGSRNRTTRFKGYASFRRATQTTKAKANALAEHAITRLIGRLN